MTVFIIESVALILTFVVFSVIVMPLTIVICKKVLKMPTEIKMLIKNAAVFMLGLFIAQVIGLLLWYGPVTSVVREADPLLSFLTFKPLQWEFIFDVGGQLYHQPVGKFFTSGQIANLYYGLGNLLSIISLAAAGAILYVRNKNHLREIALMGTTIFVVQTIIMSTWMLLIEI